MQLYTTILSCTKNAAMQAEACDIVVAQDDSMVMWLHAWAQPPCWANPHNQIILSRGKLYLMNIIMLAGTVQKL